MKVHFIGIGGIGVSALAQYFLKKGDTVTGSDLVSSEITDFLRKQRVKIYIGKHKETNISKDIDLVIYSPAVSSNNPELLKAKSYKLKTKSYPRALGEITKGYFTIAVSGTHGKSTTVAMIALILIKAGLNPTVILGTKLKEFGNSNFRMGQFPGGKPPHTIASGELRGRSVSRKIDKYLVIEADEWQASFLNYFPKIIVLTNIEREHLDYFKNLTHILRTYKKYINRLPEDGILVSNRNDENVYRLATKNRKPNIFYSLKQKEAKKMKKTLKVFGDHNVSNALAALAVARALKVSDKIAYEALSEYNGAWRRFEVIQTDFDGRKLTIISDYAHHPTEIRATLKAAREKFRKRKIWAIFQPHQYQRTYYFFNEFVKAFDLADEIILTAVYDVAGRETKKISKKVSIKKLASSLEKRGKSAHFIENFRKIPQFLRKKVKPEDIILIMGAGDIYTLVNLFSRQ